jgi:hypothetical protein
LAASSFSKYPSTWKSAASYIDPIQFWHGNIDNREVWFELLDQRDGLYAIPGFPDDLNIGDLLDDLSDGLAHMRTIISEKDMDGGACTAFS